jgi:hypothetical protein
LFSCVSGATNKPVAGMAKERGLLIPWQSIYTLI